MERRDPPATPTLRHGFWAWLEVRIGVALLAAAVEGAVIQVGLHSYWRVLPIVGALLLAQGIEDGR